MKKFLLFFVVAITMLASCGKDDEPQLYTRYEIVQELEPKSKTLNWGEMSQDERRLYPRDGYVVNSRNAFPRDVVFGMEDIKSADIDFTKYTLLMQYVLVPGYVQSHRLFWQRNNTEKKYEFVAQFSTSAFEESLDAFTYYRAAVLVKKIPENSDVSFLLTY